MRPTPEHVAQWADASDGGKGETHLKYAMDRLNAAGWTVILPDGPRFYARESDIISGLWRIVDRQSPDPMPHTTYERCHPDAKAAAEAEVGRLNDGEYGDGQ